MQYIRITKQQAIQLYYSGEKVYFHPSKLAVNSFKQKPIAHFINKKGQLYNSDLFTMRLYIFKSNYCDKDSGLTVNFFRSLNYSLLKTTKHANVKH